MPVKMEDRQIQELAVQTMAQIANSGCAGRSSFWYSQLPTPGTLERGIQKAWLQFACALAQNDAYNMRLRVMGLEILLGAATSASQKVAPPPRGHPPIAGLCARAVSDAATDIAKAWCLAWHCKP